MHPLITPLCIALARAHVDCGNSREAMQWAGRAISLSKKHLGASSPLTAACMTVQASCLVMQGSIREGGKRFMQARDLKLRAGWLGSNSSVCDDIQGYAHVLGLSGNYAAALEHLDMAATARAEYAEQGSPRSAASMTVDGLRVRFLTEQVCALILLNYVGDLRLRDLRLRDLRLRDLRLRDLRLRDLRLRDLRLRDLRLRDLRLL
jgi:hypothetical protein